MEPHAIRVDLLVGVLSLSSLIAGTGIALGYIALRKRHVLIDRLEQSRLRRSQSNAEPDPSSTATRVNLIAVAAFLLWVAFIVCLTGIRAVLI